MSADEFNRLPYERPLAVGYARGRYLATRLEGWVTAVHLHYLPSGLLVEL